MESGQPYSFRNGQGSEGTPQEEGVINTLGQARTSPWRGFHHSLAETVHQHRGLAAKTDGPAGQSGIPAIPLIRTCVCRVAG